MVRDIRNTPLQAELFEALSDLTNPTAKLFADLFAPHKNRKAKYRVDDIIEIGPEQHSMVNPKSATRVGIFIVNKFLLEPLKVFGYVNKTFTSSVWADIEDKMANALVAKDITQRQVCDYIDRSQYLLGGPLAHIINPSLSSAVMSVPPGAKKLQKQLMEEKKEQLDANDVEASSSIEKAVVKQALTEMEEQGDPSLALFKSGAIDPYNNYRTMFIMKGAIMDNTGESPTGYKIVKSNYNDGVTKEDMPIIADSLVRSAYLKGIQTADSGTLGKKYNAGLQGVRLLDEGSDCGTTEYLKVRITDRHTYRYIVENGKLVHLTPENIDKYIGKVCNLRSPVHCHAKEPCYCSICMGSRPYRIGIHNTGLTMNIISGSTLNASMKSFHDISVKFYNLQVEDLMKYVK